MFCENKFKSRKKLMKNHFKEICYHTPRIVTTLFSLGCKDGATTLSIMTISLTGLFPTHSINDIQHYDTQHIRYQYHYTECRDCESVMLSVVMLNVVMLSFVASLS